MTRLLIGLAFLCAAALGLGWLADQPGEVSLLWRGIRYHVPIAKAALFLIGAVAVFILAWTLLRSLWRFPRSARFALRARKRARGVNAVTKGMIAVGSGDVRGAQHEALKAGRILGAEPLALLLRAQAAQLSGDRAAAEAAFKAMVLEDETKPLGLRGLFIEAQRRGDEDAARAFVADAVKTSPALPWASSALLEFQTSDKDWAGALATLQRNADNHIIDKDTLRRHRAVLLTARALETVELNREGARTDLLEAVKLEPSLVPAVALAACLLADTKEARKASRLIEAAWRANPHPDLAQAYQAMRPGDTGRERLARARSLAAQAPGHPESAIAVARAALAAKDFLAARSALSQLLDRGASARVYLLMADIEQAEHGETGRLREWLSRAVRAPRDPAWIADGVVSDAWLPFSPATGRIDAFAWKTPPERLRGPEVNSGGLVIAGADEPTVPFLPVPPTQLDLPAKEPPPSGIEKSEKSKRKTSDNVPPIIAVHPAPDDPGPDAGDDPGREILR